MEGGGTAPTTYEICVKCASAENVAAFRLIGQHTMETTIQPQSL